MATPPADPKQSPVAIGRRLALIREIAGLSQVKLSRLLGVSQGTVSAFESGARPPGLKIGNRVCDVLGVTLDYIYRGDTSGLPMRTLSEINTRRNFD